MAGEVDFNTLWQEAFASALAAAAQCLPARLGFHARAEPKLLLARALGRLVSAFHRNRISGAEEIMKPAEEVNSFSL